MTSKIYNVLFLCTGNSARSIMAEAIMQREGAGKFNAFSAGSHPRGEVHPYTLNLLSRFNHPTAHLRSKDWSEFSGADAPDMDFVFTVCDRIAGEVCPVWPGQPMSAHWGFPDPVLATGTEAEIRAFFAGVYGQIANRISIFVNLPFESLDRLTLQKRLDGMGASTVEKA